MENVGISTEGVNNQISQRLGGLWDETDAQIERVIDASINERVVPHI